MVVGLRFRKEELRIKDCVQEGDTSVEGPGYEAA